MKWDKSKISCPNTEQLIILKARLADEYNLLENGKSEIGGNEFLMLQMEALAAMGFTTEALSLLCEIPLDTFDGLTSPLEDEMNSGQFFRLTRTTSLLLGLLRMDADEHLQRVLEAVLHLVPKELITELSCLPTDKLSDVLALSGTEKFRLLTVVDTIIKVFEIRESSIYTGTNVAKG
ncbi:MAG: hypothetical protein LBH17_06605 [Oscillospiraceae bacterium]|jgi:hypothetical protein|nr:hypothetical protein [Oscillospiraceae bacterium]